MSAGEPAWRGIATPSLPQVRVVHTRTMHAHENLTHAGLRIRVLTDRQDTTGLYCYCSHHTRPSRIANRSRGDLLSAYFQ